ncbi:MAG TPA: 50S ribosomal protein L10 [Planctomycetota bacterium]|nr:50S ribosomal protein L10 [Planctomycetota bacterium]
MPNLVNEILLADLQREFKNMGSCVVVEFGKLLPKQDIEIRDQLRAAGVRYRVVRSRLAKKAFASIELDLDEAMRGRCGIAIAPKEGAIQAAKILRDWIKKTKDAPLAIKGGVVEGTAYNGAAAAAIADLPDRDTVNTMIVSAISGPARSIATLVSAVAGGLARCIQAKIDAASGATEPSSS